MNSDRIKELQEQTDYPESISVYKALLQVWNECQQEHNEQLRLHIISQQRELLIEAFDLINVHDGDREKIAKLVDITLKSINCC